MGLPRATYYRLLKPPSTGGVMSTRTTRSHRALSKQEKEKIVDVLHELRFLDKSPQQIHSILLDEGVVYCSARSMYRILRSLGESRERRNVLRHPKYQKPELLATGPNQVWSWDITKLRGPVKWSNFYLYVILDIYSRYAVGWLLATRETAELAKHLISETCVRQGVETGELIIHSDRGPSMTSKTVAQLMAQLGITKSLNRPHVSNDNPYSESQFKTLKYHSKFPDRFGSIEDARAFCKYFFQWYNYEHYHSGIALMTPGTVHYGQAEACNQRRQKVLDKAYSLHPERFVRGLPRVLSLPDAVWINPPETSRTTDKPDIVGSTTIISSV